MSFRFLIFISACVFLSACGGQSGGIAPSHSADGPAVTPVDVSAESTMKYGETVTTSNGWDVSLDVTDPVEDISLANGWNVEVRYE